MSTAASSDPIAKAFFNPQVQETLKSLTGLNYEKIFRVSRLGQRLDPPSYSFMTDEELKEARREIKVKALKMLQMPPVMSERKDEVKVLEHDPAIVGFDSARYVFTDITFGIHDRDRIIVVRESDGTLRSASWSERDRMNQTYFPTEGRKFKPSSIFHLETLKETLVPKNISMYWIKIVFNLSQIIQPTLKLHTLFMILLIQWAIMRFYIQQDIMDQ